MAYKSLFSPQTAPTDDAEKSTVSHTASRAQNNTCKTKREDLTESTGVVPAKYSLKVKSELLTTLECQSWGELCVPSFMRVLGFYNGKGLTSLPWLRSLFLIRVSMNVFCGILSL